MRKRIAITGALLVASSTGTIKTKYDRYHKESYRSSMESKPSIKNIDKLFKH